MIIAIDVDGTIIDHQFPKLGKPNPGALEWIKKFQETDVKLILYTMRSDQYLEDVIQYLRDNNIEDFYGYNINPDQINWTNSPKIYANLYIDDAAYGCPLIKFDNFSRKCVDWSIVGPDVYRQIFEYYE